MTRMRIVVLAGTCALLAGTISATSFEQTAAVRITKDPQGYWFTDGDTKVLFYQAERKALPDGGAARSNYFHPLYDLDGQVLTEDFPKDHIHHRGIFWAWHQVRINGKRALITFCKVVTAGGTAILSSRFNLSLPSSIAAKSSQANRCLARWLASWNCWVSTAFASG